jgi:hypothetical protein
MFTHASSAEVWPVLDKDANNISVSQDVVMAANVSELDLLLPSRNRSTRYESFESRDFYPLTTRGPESEQISSEKRPIVTDDTCLTSLRKR